MLKMNGELPDVTLGNMDWTPSVLSGCGLSSRTHILEPLIEQAGWKLKETNKVKKIENNPAKTGKRIW